MAFFILFSSNVDKLYWAFIVSAICVGVFFISERRYSKLFVENPEKSNTIFAVENFATFALIFYLPVTLSGKSQHNDGAIGAFGAFLLLIPILIIVIAACIYRNQSVCAELKE